MAPKVALEHADGSGSPPRVVADVIMRALSARRPRTRYAMGSGAKPILLARALLTDRAYDAVVRRLIGG